MTHHTDCDGYRMHSVHAARTEHGTYVPECPLCGLLPVIGSAGSPDTAVKLAGDHSQSVPCAGECSSWS